MNNLVVYKDDIIKFYKWGENERDESGRLTCVHIFKTVIQVYLNSGHGILFYNYEVENRDNQIKYKNKFL